MHEGCPAQTDATSRLTSNEARASSRLRSPFFYSQKKKKRKKHQPFPPLVALSLSLSLSFSDCPRCAPFALTGHRLSYLSRRADIARSTRVDFSSLESRNSRRSLDSRSPFFPASVRPGRKQLPKTRNPRCQTHNCAVAIPARDENFLWTHSHSTLASGILHSYV